jgi:hypothetical protein
VRADFWREAHKAGFFAGLDAFRGPIHLVFGEHDRFDPDGLRFHAAKRFEEKSHLVSILDGQDHSS